METPFVPADFHAPAANTAAVVAYAAAPGSRHVIRGGICWSYNAVPVGGNLKIEDGATTVFSMDITTAGAGFIPIDDDKIGDAGVALTITLAAGGADVTGKVNVLSHRTI